MTFSVSSDKLTGLTDRNRKLHNVQLFVMLELSTATPQHHNTTNKILPSFQIGIASDTEI